MENTDVVEDSRSSAIIGSNLMRSINFHIDWKRLNWLISGPEDKLKHFANVASTTNSKIWWRHGKWKSVWFSFCCTIVHASREIPVLLAVVSKLMPTTLCCRFLSVRHCTTTAAVAFPHPYESCGTPRSLAVPKRSVTMTGRRSTFWLSSSGSILLSQCTKKLLLLLYDLLMSSAISFLRLRRNLLMDDLFIDISRGSCPRVEAAADSKWTAARSLTLVWYLVCPPLINFPISNWIRALYFETIKQKSCILAKF